MAAHHARRPRGRARRRGRGRGRAGRVVRGDGPGVLARAVRGRRRPRGGRPGPPRSARGLRAHRVRWPSGRPTCRTLRLGRPVRVALAPLAATCCASCGSRPPPGRSSTRSRDASGGLGRRGPLLRLRRARSASSCPRPRWPWPTRSCVAAPTPGADVVVGCRQLVPACTCSARAERERPPGPTRHLAEVLAAALPDGGAGDRRDAAEPPARAAPRCAQRTADAPSPTTGCGANVGPRRRPLRLATATAGLADARRRRRPAPAPPAAREAESSPTCPACSSASPTRSWPGAATSAGRRRRPTPATTSSTWSGAHGATPGREVEVDGHRGDRPQRALEAAGAEVVETDLGEWIIQLAGRDAQPHHRPRPAPRPPPDPGPVRRHGGRPARPRHRADRARRASPAGGCARSSSPPTSASPAPTSAWPRPARSCSSPTRATAAWSPSLPRVHVAVMGMERVVADWDQLDLLLALLARSATGQRAVVLHQRASPAPRGPGEADGPDELHVVILDNGRSDLLGGEFHEMLGCIRCGACLNVCPVYRQIGGHAYGWVYPGPMGAVLTPLLAGDQPEAAEVADASTLCGACMDACPVADPAPGPAAGPAPPQGGRRAAGRERAAWRAWAAAWSTPAGYRATTRAATWSRWAASPGRPAARRHADWARGRTLPRPARRAVPRPLAGRAVTAADPVSAGPRDRRPGRVPGAGPAAVGRRDPGQPGAPAAADTGAGRPGPPARLPQPRPRRPGGHVRGGGAPRRGDVPRGRRRRPRRPARPPGRPSWTAGRSSPRPSPSPPTSAPGSRPGARSSPRRPRERAAAAGLGVTGGRRGHRRHRIGRARQPGRGRPHRLAAARRPPVCHRCEQFVPHPRGRPAAPRVGGRCAASLVGAGHRSQPDRRHRTAPHAGRTRSDRPPCGARDRCGPRVLHQHVPDLSRSTIRAAPRGPRLTGAR